MSLKNGYFSNRSTNTFDFAVGNLDGSGGVQYFYKDVDFTPSGIVGVFFDVKGFEITSYVISIVQPKPYDIEGIIDAEVLRKPTTAGTSGQVLVSDGEGGQVWGTVGEGEIVVDNTLTVSGAAADAKVTGDEITSVKADITNTQAMTAPAFSTATNYTAGQYVIYEEVLYRFTQNHAAGAWNSAHVTAVDVADVLEDFETRKANVDGYYEDLTAGNADQLVATVGINDKVPYLFRTSGGSVDIGDREVDEIIGGTVAWNQLVQNGNFTTDAGWDVSSPDGSTVTKTASNNELSIEISGSNPIGSVITRPSGNYAYTLISGHKYLYSVEMKHDASEEVASYIGNVWKNFGTLAANTWKRFEIIVAPTSNLGRLYIYLFNNSQATSGAGSIKNVGVIDITQMFGSTIADYLYSLEQSTAGSGIAKLKEWGFCTKPYYAYNAGQLMSVKTSAHKMVGFNQWLNAGSEITPNQGVTLNEDGSVTLVTKSYQERYNAFYVVPNAPSKFQISGDYEVLSANDSRTKFGITWVYSDGTKSTPATISAYPVGYKGRFCVTSEEGKTVAYVTFGNWGYNGSVEITNICLSLYWDGERDGEYEPYTVREYALDATKDWRGVFKLDANNKLYTDGDVYPSSGEVTRKYAEITLDGTQEPTTVNWRVSDTSVGALFTYSFTNNAVVSENVLPDMVVVGSNPVTYNALYGASVDTGVGFVSSANTYGLAIRIPDTTATTKQAVQTYLANHPIKIVYKLDPAYYTTEEADPYQNPQIVDDWGTEEYVDTRDVPIPVGHDTVYRANLKAKLEMSPDSPSGDGDYLVRQTNGENEYVEYVSPVPTAPTENGTYVLKVTVSGGTPTLAWVAES